MTRPFFDSELPSASSRSRFPRISERHAVFTAVTYFQCILGSRHAQFLLLASRVTLERFRRFNSCHFFALYPLGTARCAQHLERCGHFRVYVQLRTAVFTGMCTSLKPYIVLKKLSNTFRRSEKYRMFESNPGPGFRIRKHTSQAALSEWY